MCRKFASCGGQTHVGHPEFPTKMEWYMIPEIRFRDYVECLGDIYAARSVTIPIQGDTRDAFTKAVISFDQDHEIFRMREKKISMAFGYFHQNLAGKFNGYQTLKNGTSSGLDVIKEDGSEFWEWKNRHNTMNAASAKETENKLMAQVNQGRRAFLVQVNCPGGKVSRFKMAAAITILNGEQAYAYISGRPNFFSDLITTLTETFVKFKTYSEIQQFAGQLHEPASQVPHSQSACTAPTSPP